MTVLTREQWWMQKYFHSHSAHATQTPCHFITNLWNQWNHSCTYVQPRGSYWNQDKSCFRKCMYIYLNYFFSNHIWVFINLNWLRTKFSRFSDLSLLVRSDHAMQTFSLCAYLLKVFTEKVVEWMSEIRLKSFGFS